MPEKKCGVKVFAEEKPKFRKSPLESSTDKTWRELEARLEAVREREKAARETKRTVRGTIVSTVNRSDGTVCDFIRVGDRPSLVKRERKRTS